MVARVHWAVTESTREPAATADEPEPEALVGQQQEVQAQAQFAAAWAVQEPQHGAPEWQQQVWRARPPQ